MTIQRSKCRTCSSQEQAFRDRNAILMFANQAYNDHRDPCTIGRTRRCCVSLVYLPCMLSGPKGRTNKYNQIGALNDVDDHFTSFRRSFHLVKFTVLDVLSRLNRDHGARFVEQIISDLLYRSKFSLRFIMYFSKRKYTIILYRYTYYVRIRSSTRRQNEYESEWVSECER